MRVPCGYSMNEDLIVEQIPGIVIFIETCAAMSTNNVYRLQRVAVEANRNARF